MAKVPFTKLGAKISQEIVTIDVPNYEHNIEVIQYLPVQDKLALLERVILASYNSETGFSNPLKEYVYFIMEVIFTYTNISFTDKQKEDISKLFDSIICAPWYEELISALPDEVDELQEFLRETINSYYKYRTSALGIMDSISRDYTELNEGVEELQQNISNKENLALLRQIVGQMG